MVIVRDQYLKAHPDVVRRFIAASVRGWQDYIWGDPAPGNRLILKNNKDMTADIIAFSRAEMKARRMLGDRDQVGRMSAARWQAFYREMSALGALPPKLNPDQLFSTDFLPAEKTEKEKAKIAGGGKPLP